MKKRILGILILLSFLTACVPATPTYDFELLLKTATIVAAQVKTRVAKSDLANKIGTFTPIVIDQMQSTPVQTPEPEPVTTPAPLETERAEFVPYLVQADRPEGVLEYIRFANPPGGGIVIGCSGEYPYPLPESQSSSNQAELLDYLLVTFCGWEKGESVEVTSIYPDGRQVIQQYTADTAGGVDQAPFVMARLELKSDDPPGTYQMIARGEQSQEARHEISVSLPNRPHIVFQPDADVLLSYFQPKEKVRLFVYEPLPGTANYRFKQWQEFVVDENGKLLVETEEVCEFECYYSAIGDQSGEAFDNLSSQDYLSILTSGSPQAQCTGAPLQRLAVGKKAFVCTLDQTLLMRKQPRQSSKENGQLQPNTYFEIIDGPVCADESSYWRIRLDSGRTGWVVEDGNDTDPYSLCPAP